MMRARPARRPPQPGPAASSAPPATAMSAVSPVAAAADKRVSFAFAKRHGVLVGAVIDGVAQCTVRGGASALALAEVRRYLRLPVHIDRVDEATFDGLLREAYETGATNAMTPSAALRATRTSHTWAQVLPEQTDLLEADDDAPIIRLINAVLTPSGERERLGHPYRAVREPSGRTLPRRRRAARGAAVQARGGSAGGVTSESDVQARYRREASAPGRPHQSAHRRAGRRCARIHYSEWPRRARGCCVSWTSRPAGST